MLPQSHLAVVARNLAWSGPGRVETEPHECGWAREAVIFVRLLKPPRWRDGPGRLIVESGPDGLHWAPLGVEVELPATEEAMALLRVRHFGGWLRLAGTLAEGESATVLISVHLKA